MDPDGRRPLLSLEDGAATVPALVVQTQVRLQCVEHQGISPLLHRTIKSAGDGQETSPDERRTFRARNPTTLPPSPSVRRQGTSSLLPLPHPSWAPAPSASPAAKRRTSHRYMRNVMHRCPPDSSLRTLLAATKKSWCSSYFCPFVYLRI